MLLLSTQRPIWFHEVCHITSGTKWSSRTIRRLERQWYLLSGKLWGRWNVGATIPDTVLQKDSRIPYCTGYAYYTTSTASPSTTVQLFVQCQLCIAVQLYWTTQVKDYSTRYCSMILRVLGNGHRHFRDETKNGKAMWSNSLVLLHCTGVLVLEYYSMIWVPVIVPLYWKIHVILQYILAGE